MPNGRRPQSYGHPAVSHPDMRPPSPPIDPQLGFNHPIQSSSPITSSRSSTTTGAPYPGAPFRSLESHPGQNGRSSTTNSQSVNRSPPDASPHSSYPGSPYSETPPSSSAYGFQKVATSGAQHLYYQQQRPVPTTFAPSMSGNVNPITPPSGDTSPIESNNSQWHHQHQHQHHHYIAPSHSASFSGQNSDRYVCPVCSKAFSRPSSLRIHSHSHTGEKPFLCPHKGCGKAFSVRSNMKRHERGCHGGGESGD